MADVAFDAQEGAVGMASRLLEPWILNLDEQGVVDLVWEADRVAGLTCEPLKPPAMAPTQEQEWMTVGGVGRPACIRIGWKETLTSGASPADWRRWNGRLRRRHLLRVLFRHPLRWLRHVRVSK
jgi:hypothetical protein